MSDVIRSASLAQERIKLLYRNYPFTLSANVLVGTLVAWTLWDFLPHGTVLAWVAAQWAMTAKGVMDYRNYLQSDHQTSTARDVRAYGNLRQVSAITGGLWGSAMVMTTISPSPIMQQIVFTAIIGMAFGGALFLSVEKGIFSLYIALIMLPTIAAFLYMKLPYHGVFAGFSLILYIVTLAFAHNVHRMIERSLSLRFDNLQLIDELKKQKNTADYANLSKSRFLAAASHDLRQPMHALSLFVSALGAQLREPAAVKLMSHIVKAVNTLNTMFNALLDVSKLDAGIQENTPQHFAVQPLFDRLLDEFRLTAEARGLRLQVVPSRLVLHADITLVERCVRNLLSNALQYTQKGGVVLGCRRQGALVRLEVWDSGIGISPELHGEIFQEFFQVNNAERDRNHGVGLGLAIVQRISRLIQCPIGMRSIPGRGSMFSLQVPRGLQVEIAAPPQHNNAATSFNLLEGVRVGLVDDDPEVISAMQALLPAWGCQLLTGESGDALLHAMAEHHFQPQLMISDFRLRNGEDGASLIRQVEQAIGQTLPSIIITGDTGKERLLEAKASGYTLLHKPVSPGKLRALMTHLLSKPLNPTES